MAILNIDTVQAAGVAAGVVVSIELTDQRGDPVTGYVIDTDEVIVIPTTVTTDAAGQVAVDLIPNVEIEPGNTCYTVRVANKQYLIQKGIGTQNLFEALVQDVGPLDPITQNELQDHINDPTGAHPSTAISATPFATVTGINVQTQLEEIYNEAITGLDEASEIQLTPFGDIVATNVQDGLEEVDGELHTITDAQQIEIDAVEAGLAAHLADTVDAHDASAISVVPFSTISSTNVQDALAEVLLESTPAASGVPFTPTGDIVATNVQAAIVEVDAELHAHEADTVDAHGASAISYVPANVLDQTNVQDAITELGESFSTPKTPSGFPNTTDTTIAVVDSGANLTFTLAPVGASFDVWIFGDKFTKTTETVLLTDGLDRVYYIYYDAAGVLSQTNNTIQPLGFNWSTQVPVAIVFRNATGLDLVLFDTRHGLSMDWATRGYLHSTRGTQMGTGLALSDYVLSPGSPVNDDNTWSQSAGTILNEDLTYSIPAVADDSTYTTIYKNLTGTFASSIGATPFALSAGDLAYNLNTAGSYSLAAVPNGSYVNYYVVCTGSATAGYQVFAFPEETYYASQALATAAPITSPFPQGGFAFSEFFLRHRITYQRSNAYTTTGRCRTVAVTTIANSQTLIAAGATPTAHGSLSGRSDADQHPAASITNTPTGTIAATTVQAAIDELATDKVETDGSYAAVGTDALKTRVTGNANPRFTLNADGSMEFGNGTATADTTLYRSNADELKTDDAFVAGTKIGIGITPGAAALTLPTGTTAAQGILFDGDVTLYRSAADTLRTDDNFSIVGGSFGLGTTPNNDRFFNLDNSPPGTGSTQYGFFVTPEFKATTTVAAYGGFIRADTIAGSFTLAEANGLFVGGPAVGAGSAITSSTGILVGTQSAATTTNYGIRLGTATTRTLWVGYESNPTTAAGGITFGSSADTNLYRSAADTLKTDDTFESAVNLIAPIHTASGSVRVGATPAASGAVRLPNSGWLACRNGTNTGDVNMWTVVTTSILAGADVNMNGQSVINVAGFTNNDGGNIVVGATTGSKIGTATSQKIGFWNATPVVQPTTAVTAAAFVANTSLIANDSATFGGYTIGQVVAALKSIGVLA